MNELFNFLPTEETFLLSTEDEFLGEYTPENFKRLQFLTGFTGSYGFAVIRKNGANLLFVDGRYTLQAGKEVLPGFEVHGIEGLVPKLKELGEVALSSKTHSFAFIKKLKESGVKVNALEENPVDKLWKRNLDVSRETFEFELAGETKQEKLAKLRAYIQKNNADAIFIFNPSEVCWLFNIRGNFLPNTPFAPFVAIVSREAEELLTLEQITNIKAGKVLVPQHISLYCYEALASNNEVILAKENYLENHKAIKTEFEIECMRRAFQEDGKALTSFYKWLKKTNLENETEFTVAEKLTEFRKGVNGFKEESFPAIVGFCENGAIVHYKPEKNSAKKITGKGLLLVDSGGQYYDVANKICGTTDVTRVFAIGGEPTAEEKRVFTLCLKGHIALSRAVFKEGTTGAELDILARQFLYREGLNYTHGTGHGVGYFLSVHEGPGGISKNYHVPLKTGMVISNEPGCYLEGKFGVRFEGLVLVKPSINKGFLEFENLTKAPIEKTLLDYEILTDEEINWLTENSI